MYNLLFTFFFFFIIFLCFFFFFFFFSSRRRHTRCGRDWSSDVCSSDLPLLKVNCNSASTSAGCASSTFFATASTKLVKSSALATKSVSEFIDRKSVV